MTIKYNAPATLNLTFLSLSVLVLGFMNEDFMLKYFVLQGGLANFDIKNPFQIATLFTHIFGHVGIRHFAGNFMLILLLGPIIEEKYGSIQLFAMILITAICTGLINLFFLSSGLLGASGIAFMMIILSSITNVKKGEIPLTFILICILYLSSELFRMFEKNNIAEFAHILGGICGALYGFLIVNNKTESNILTK